MKEEYLKRRGIIDDLQKVIDEYNANAMEENEERFTRSDYIAEGLSIALKIIKNKPADEVEDFEEAEWIILKKTKTEIAVKCSKCGYTYKMVDFNSINDLFNVCPKCESRMKK